VRTLNVWHGETGKLISAVLVNNYYTPVVCIGEDMIAIPYSERNAAGSREEGAAILSLPDLKLIRKYSERAILAASSDAKLTLQQIYQKDFKKPPKYELWDEKSGKARFPIDIGDLSRIVRCEFLPDGKRMHLLTQSSRYLPSGKHPTPTRVLIVDLANGKCEKLVEATLENPFTEASALSPDGKTCLVGGAGPYDKAIGRRGAPVRFYNINSGRFQEPAGLLHPVRKSIVYGLQYLPSGSHVVVVGKFGLGIWDLETDQVATDLKVPEDFQSGDGKVVFAVTTETISVLAHSPKAVHVWKVEWPK